MQGSKLLTEIMLRWRTWWRHGMEMLSSLLALCEGDPPVIEGFTSQKANDVFIVIS